MAERARLESVCTGNTVPRVRIPPSPINKLNIKTQKSKLRSPFGTIFKRDVNTLNCGAIFHAGSTKPKRCLERLKA